MMAEYKCKNCKDIGWTTIKKGDKEYVKKCDCILIQNEKQFTPEYYQIGWDKSRYELDYLKMGINFLNDPYMRILLLWGKSDVGKTLLSWKLKNYYAKIHGFRWTAHYKNKQIQNMLHLIGLGTFDDRMEKIIEDHKACIYSKLLVIDDFFAGPDSKTERFTDSFDSFFDSLLAKKIIITMNDFPGDDKDIGEPGHNLANISPTTYNRFKRPENGWQWIEMKKREV
jgi:DNA replication protein DnaC